MSIRWNGFPLWIDYWLLGRIRLLVVALITVAAVTLLLTTISSRLPPSQEGLHGRGETLKARIDGLTSSLGDAARLISEIDQEVSWRRRLEERLQHDAQEAGRLTELTPEQVVAVTQALRENSLYEARTGFWYTALTNLFFAFVGAGISELFRLYRRRRMSRRSRQAS